jgi:flagellar biosynthesis anti-sigma factor FlgM
MNIGNNIENLTQIFDPQTVTGATPAKAAVQNETQNEAQKTDQAQVSTAASQVAQSVASSDIRLDKVASIQSALQAGTYSVPASAVAQKVVDSLLATDK